MFGRGGGGAGNSFDARQKIGVNDVRQRLGGGAGNDQQTFIQNIAFFVWLLCFVLFFTVQTCTPIWSVSSITM